MAVYLGTILCSWLIAAFAQQHPVVYTTKQGQLSKKISNVYIFLLLAIWVCVFAFRGLSVGSDTNGYYYFYRQMQHTGESVYRDQLFVYLEQLCNKIFNGSWIAYQAVVAVFIYLPTLLTLKKKPEFFSTSILLFFFNMFFYGGFNGTRQAIASSLVFFAYYAFLEEKKYIKFSLIMLIAFGFHSSTLLVLPVLLLTRFKVDGIFVKIAAALTFLSSIFIRQIWPLVINFLFAIGQTKMAEDYAEIPLDKGAGYLRIFVLLLPFILGYIFKNKLSPKYKEFNGELILILFGALLRLLSTQYWVFARIGGYFNRATLLLIPKLFDAFDKKNKNIAGWIILALYFVYMILLLLKGEGAYYPYVSIFNSGGF